MGGAVVDHTKVIEIHELSKVYGKVVAVNALSLSIPTTSVFGIVGPEGAGKTTLLRILATLTKPTSGEVTVAGIAVTGNTMRIRRIVGYMPDSFGSYQDMTVAEYLSFFAACYGVPQSERASLISDLLQLVDLAHRRDDPVDRLTHGTRQRLSLARTLAHDPQVLLLDEPFRGIDPRAHVEMRELIRELRNMGKTVVVTTATLADLDGLCTHVAIMEQGHLIGTNTYAAVVARTPPHRTISVKFFGNVELAVSIAQTIGGTQEVFVVSTGEAPPEHGEPDDQQSAFTTLKELHIIFTGKYEDATELLRILMRSGVQVVSFSEQADEPGALLPHFTSGQSAPTTPA